MKATVWTLVLVLGSCAAAEAQPQASAFGDLWQHVKSGDTVFVTDGSGRETTGVFAKVSDSNLSLLVDGQLRDLPVMDVRQIARRGDSVWNGFLIGAALGAAIEIASFANCDDTYEECVHPAAAGAVGGLVFGGVGALIDHFIKGRTVVFRVKNTALRLRPGAAVGQHGVSASLAVWAN